MKVVLKPSVLDAIYKRIVDADMTNRKVDYILVTPEEYREVRREVVPNFNYGLHGPSSMPSDAKVQTIALDNPYQRYAQMRFASHEMLFGFPLYVVPSEYIPK